MEEKRYLKWYNKMGYGSGDIAGNVVYAFLTSFVMVYLTDTIGLASGIVGTLIALSKLFDGFTDIFFGSMIDKTHSRLGKARPWMLYGYIGCAVTLVACFAIPTNLGKTAQYAWFFIAYTLLNGVFYTANNIAYSALTSLVTKNSKERVQMGSCRFIFAFSTSLLIQAITVGFVEKCGGDAAAWRLVAIIYAAIGLIVNTISALSVKELPEEELNEGEQAGEAEKYGLVQAFKLLVKNKFYLMICGTYILQQLYSAMIGAGIYYMTWVLKNKNLFGQFAWAVNIPLIIALIFTPTLVGKWNGMYKLNVRGYMLATVGRALVVVAGYMGSVPLMILFTAVAALGQGPWQGDMNAVIASCSEYTYLTQGKHVDGTMYSCTSLGIKIGGGIGTAVVGWLLEFSGYVGTNATQPQSALSMMQFIYLWLPFVFDLLITIVLSQMNVEETNANIRKARGMSVERAEELFEKASL
ncbi:MAG: glycoside-pentoside-hexuronide (GPH):cation symporter [Lachnobacterium sp.]|nr:glycoside-pentoside-hexuronide (GPH):cation symporter [Lachnobacterium sp.]MDD7713307.1 glycoside-pentoside-hexuronide (GPH):cation symporter [Lachnobacterium sp.]MDY5461561.1 glycoside-pentoside-hexuronide (GPH):cation symporter [Agathobacter sp.]